MPKVHPIQTNFSQGELSPLMESRYDLDIHGAGLNSLLNMYTDSRGPAKSREAMKYLTRFDGSICKIETIYNTDTSFSTLVFLGLILNIIPNIGSSAVNTLVAPWAASQLKDVQIVPYPVDKSTYILHPNVQSQKLWKYSPAWNTSDLSYLQSADISTQDNFHFGLTFKPDGTKVYTTGDTNNSVYEYDLSAAWDISTLAFNGSFSVAAQDTLPIVTHFSKDGSKMFMLGSQNLRVYEYKLSVPWDVTTAVFNVFESISAQDFDPQGLVFSVDGSRMYMTGDTGGNVYEYLLDVPWDLSTLAFVHFFNTSAQDAVPTGLDFNEDGSKMYVLGATADTVYEYDLFTAWDVTSSVYLQSFSVAAQDATPQDIHFKDDGLKMYMVGTTGDNIYEYDLESADTDNFVLEPVSFVAKPDSWTGTNWPGAGYKHQGRLWLGGSSDDPEEFWGSKSGFPENFSLGTGLADEAMQHSIDEVGRIQWMTATDSLIIGTVNGEFTIVADTGLLKPGDLEAKRQSSYGSMHSQPVVIGDQILYASADSRKIRAVNYEWRQDSWKSVDMTFPSEHITEGLIAQMAWAQNPNNLLWVVLKDGTLGCMTYERGTNTYGWHRHDTQGQVLSIAAGSDGQRDILVLAILRLGKVYIECLSFDYDFDSYLMKINVNSIPSGRDISTAVYLQSFDISTQDVAPAGIFFKSDGLKMYMIGNANDSVYEYDLSTAWNISTAVYSQLFSVSTQDIFPSGVFFKSDGVKMYVVGTANDSVYEYDLSAAWDISTAVYLQSFSVFSEEAAPTGLFFKPNGKKMYVVGNTTGTTYEYDLSAAWDISTAVYLQLFDVSAQDAFPHGMFLNSNGLKMYVVGAANDNIYEYDLFAAWDISTAVYLQSFDISGEETIPVGIFLKPDGLKVYTVGVANTNVYEYDVALSDGYWDISTAAFGQDFSVAAQDTTPVELVFKPDGLKMYVVGSVNDNVYEYDLSTAWDILTAVYSQSFDVSGEEASPTGLFFKSGGKKMYLTGTTTGTIYEYDLSTAWDISTAVYLQLFSVSAQDAIPNGLAFSPSGLKMYIAGDFNDNIYEYDLSSAWNISTAVYLQLFDVSTQDGSPQGVVFRSDGMKMYMVGFLGSSVYEYNLSMAWDISTAVFLQDFDVSSEEPGSNGLAFKSDGSRMYITGFTNDKVVEYVMGAFAINKGYYIGGYDHLEGQEVQVLVGGSYQGTVVVGAESEAGAANGYLGRIYLKPSVEPNLVPSGWDISTTVFNQDFDVSAQDTFPIGMFLRPDGLKMYVVGITNDKVYEYDLSTAWDISTAVSNQDFDVSAQDTVPTNIYFKSDGLKMYVLGDINDSVFEYDLSVAWDISTTAFNQGFNVATQDTAPNGVFFRPDGKKMYIIGATNDSIYEYDLSTAWDISTAVYFQLFGVSAQDISPQGLSFRSGGSKMYVIGATNNKIYEYDLGTDWDISTAVFLRDFSVNAQDTFPRGMFFNPDGLKVYTVGSVGDSIYEYNLDQVGYDADVVVGLGYTSEMETLDMDEGSPTGSAASHMKRRNKVYIKVLNSGPFLINDKRIKDISGQVVMDGVPALYSGLALDISLNWDRGGTVSVKQDLPFPLKVTAILGEIVKNAL